MSLKTQSNETLAFLAKQMKGTMRAFAKGERDITAPYAMETFRLSNLFLTTIESEIRNRGLNPDSAEFGGSVEGIRGMMA